MNPTLEDIDTFRAWPVIRVCQRVAVIHAAVILFIITISWNAGWSEIGPTWLLFAFLDWPASILVVRTFVDDLFDYETYKVFIVFGILLLGTIQWVFVAALVSVARNWIVRHLK